MSASSRAGTLMIQSLGPALFGTATSSIDDDPSDLLQSDLLPDRALNELEAEYAAASSGTREDGAAPASQLSRIYARRFLQALAPEDQPSDIYFNHQGDAVLEWHPAKGLAAAILIGGNGSIRFASTRFGTRTSGTHFLTGSIPTEALQAIRRGGKC